MAQLWEVPISQQTISRPLRKIGNSRKKTYGYCQRNEAKRAAFLEQLENPKASHLVYVDESGMDERDNYGYGSRLWENGFMTSNQVVARDALI